MRNDKEDTILRSDAIEAVYRAYRRPSDDEVFIRMREELERVPETSVATVQANVEIDMDELVKRVTEEIRNSFILDPVGWIPCSERLPELTIHENEPFIGEWDNSEPVLIYHKDNKYEYPYLIAQYTNGFENNEVGWTEMNDAKEVIDVMAWMPLPEPWKGADDETAND